MPYITLYVRPFVWFCLLPYQLTAHVDNVAYLRFTNTTVIHKLILISIIQTGHICLYFNLQIDRTGRIPMLRFRDRESYAGNKTKEYDDMAMKYLTYVLLFLVACSSIYSLKYEQHKSWYSWILSSFTSCVYMFGKLLILLTSSFTVGI